jgi:DNA-binding LacI/PurR family transcriptional regulator
MGQMAVEMLLDRIEHPDKQIPSKSVYGVLLERDSVKTINQ